MATLHRLVAALVVLGLATLACGTDEPAPATSAAATTVPPTSATTVAAATTLTPTTEAANRERWLEEWDSTPALNATRGTTPAGAGSVKRIALAVVLVGVPIGFISIFFLYPVAADYRRAGATCRRDRMVGRS